MGLHDLAVLIQFAGASIKAIFMRLLPEIETQRFDLNNPNLYAGLEWLAQEADRRVQSL